MSRHTCQLVQPTPHKGWQGALYGPLRNKRLRIAHRWSRRLLQEADHAFQSQRSCLGEEGPLPGWAASSASCSSAGPRAGPSFRHIIAELTSMLLNYVKCGTSGQFVGRSEAGRPPEKQPTILGRWNFLCAPVMQDQLAAKPACPSAKYAFHASCLHKCASYAACELASNMLGVF